MSHLCNDGRRHNVGSGWSQAVRGTRDAPVWQPLPPPAPYPLTHLRPEYLEKAREVQLLGSSKSLPGLRSVRRELKFDSLGRLVVGS